MNGTTALPRRSFGETMRADVWWTQSLVAETRLVARLADLFSCATRSLGPGRIPPHMLLLPRRLL